MKEVIVIGSGFSGISAACHLAAKGYRVKVVEKNEGPGGRASLFRQDGFTFDMGPSWYWMPDIIEGFFNQFGRSAADYYQLVRLDPSYRIYFQEGPMDIPAGREALSELFESLETGSSVQLGKFLEEAQYKYRVGIGEFAYKPGRSVTEFMDLRVLRSVFKLHMLKSMAKYVDNRFKNPQLRELLKFPVLFLGATPEKTPALYSLMNYADLELGTWYPMGGMHEIIRAMVALAEEQGVEFLYDCPARKIIVENHQAVALDTERGKMNCDILVGSADYHHVEQHLLKEPYRNYSAKYWKKRVMAPSCLLFYLGVDRRIAGLEHHNLFFDAAFSQHAREVYDTPAWPSDPLFYVCCPSRTDPSVAPEGKENIFLLMPAAPGLNDDPNIRERYFDIMMDRLEHHTSENIRDSIIFKKSFAHSDFIQRYNAFRGNAYGLANTLKQTAFLKPSFRNKKVRNLFFTGQLTVPGPGVPPSIISGQIVAREISKTYQ